jgi:nucleotide-binding universal stress UspA family protein
MILICYDGSGDARAAIGQAATLMPGHPALVVTVWTPAEPGSNGAGTDERTWAEAVAADGARCGHAAAIDCAPHTVCHRGTVAEAILKEADRLDARAIVTGRGGAAAGDLRKIGPVPSALLREARCAVLVAGPALEPAFEATEGPERWRGQADDRRAGDNAPPLGTRAALGA